MHTILPVLKSNVDDLGDFRRNTDPGIGQGYIQLQETFFKYHTDLIFGQWYLMPQHLQFQ